jgi:hypothetical protein
VRAAGLPWVIAIGIYAVFALVSMVRGEVRMHRVRQSFRRLEQAYGDPAAFKNLLANDSGIGRFLSKERLAQLNHVGDRLAATAALRAGTAAPGDADLDTVTERLAADPEMATRVMQMLKPIAEQHDGLGGQRLRDLIADLETREKAELDRHVAPIPLVLRPKAGNSTVRVRSALGVFGLLFLLFTAIIAVPVYSRHPVFATIVEVVFVALCGLYFLRRWRHLQTVTLFIDATQVGQTSGLGVRHAVNRSAVDSVYLSKQVILSYHGATTIRRRMFVVGKNRRPLLRVNGEYWSGDDMTTFAATLGVPLQGSWSMDETGDELRRKLPESITWWAAHPNVFWFLIMLAAVPIAIVAIVVLTSP